ncbi:hypothetical protein DPMN_136255 [Dreissena polymorpha]|uniref:Uncharacterized protein n=1 Tax=Dreissena polymorpha TaxID=45954 RepID=A0A9D4JHM1_DREPO|nr:hypothetical protein DPMN_136255 [Dreissena polymorpha]
MSPTTIVGDIKNPLILVHTSNREFRGPRHKLKEEPLFIGRVGGEDLVEELDCAAVVGVPVVGPTALHEHLGVPDILLVTTEQQLQLKYNNIVDDYLKYFLGTK